MVHHGHRCNEDERCNHLVRVEARVKEAPRDAHRGQRLHHLEIARRRSTRETKPFKINQERNSARDRSEENQQDDRLGGVRLRGRRPERRDMPIITPRPATVERPQKSAQISAYPVPLLSPARSNEMPISAGCATETKIPARMAMLA